MMRPDQRGEMVRRFIHRWARAPKGSAEEHICKNVAYLLNYGASVRTVAKQVRVAKAKAGVVWTPADCYGPTLVENIYNGNGA